MLNQELAMERTNKDVKFMTWRNLTDAWVDSFGVMNTTARRSAKYAIRMWA